MQDSKHLNSPKNTNVKSTYGSPPNKIKTTTSPRHTVANNKSPVGTVSPKVGQWKTDRNPYMNNNVMFSFTIGKEVNQKKS